MKLKVLLLSITALFTVLNSFAQQVDTTQPVDIIHSDFLYFQEINPTTQLQILSGNVRLRQGKTIFTCDSCVINNASNIFEAFGKVHINDSDTTDIYSDYLRYHTDTKMAYFTGNVKLTDGHGTLTTRDLDYDVNNKIGNYRNGGRLVNKKSVLTSEEGTYYTDLRDIYFRKKVELKDPAYYLKSDSLLYNTETQVARFITETYIRDSSKRVIRTREGFYDMANKRAEFLSRTAIEDGPRRVWADNIASDDKTGITQLEGRAVFLDTAQGVHILADRIFVNNKTDAVLATKKPLMIIRQDKDSIYITGDTLFTARLTELYRNDTVMLKKLNFKKEKDSTNRYFEAYRHVKIFSDSLQSVSDSMFYTFKDSVFHLYYDPIVWNGKSQITADTIYLYTKNKKADRVKAWENSFMVNEIEPGVYNQIKSIRMDGYFREGQIDSVRAKGTAESIYFLQDKDSAYTGTNQTSSDAIDIYFLKGELDKVVFRNGLKGTLYPIAQKTPTEMRLQSFRWQIDRRPKTKYDLME